MSQVEIGIHRQIRTSIHTAVSGLSAGQLQAMPGGFDNNIAWNLGHILVVQQRLLYSRCGLPMSVSEEMIPLYLPGTSPTDWETEPDAEALAAMLIPQEAQLEEDFASGLFADSAYDPYTTSSGFTISDLGGALAFNNYHEAQHYGFILALINFVG